MQFTSSRDRRHTDSLWNRLGGTIRPVRRTGEVFYEHPAFSRPVRACRHRKDTVAVVVTRINQLIKGRVPAAA